MMVCKSCASTQVGARRTNYNEHPFPQELCHPSIYIAYKVGASTQVGAGVAQNSLAPLHGSFVYRSILRSIFVGRWSMFGGYVCTAFVSNRRGFLLLNTT